MDEHEAVEEERRGAVVERERGDRVEGERDNIHRWPFGMMRVKMKLC